LGVTARVKFLPLIAALAAAALALAIVTASQAGKGDIFGTDHDTGSPGSPTCAQCHIPHEAEGTYLWASVPYSPYAGDSDILPLCFSCHDGAVATSGAYLPDADHTHAQGVVMYDDDHDPGTPDIPVTEYSLYEATCRKCMEPDCIRCHDAHSDAFVFLDADLFQPIDTDGDDIPDTDTLNASLCISCHEGWRHGVQSHDPVDLDGDTEPDEYYAIGHSTHPEMITEPDGAGGFGPPPGADRHWDGDASDFSGIRLWSDDTSYSSIQGAPDIAQYVVESSNADIRCMSCHTPHGAQNDQLTAMASSTEVDSGAPICQNCHE
jgi:predicted CXXCH cytochrome family protein